MAYLCCGPETQLSVTYSGAQKDPLIYLWGFEVMTGERGDECVCVCWGGRGRCVTTRSTGILENAAPDTWKSFMGCPGRTHSPSLLRGYNQPQPPPPTLCAPRPPSGPETGDAVRRSEPPPRHPHSLSFVRLQCGASTVSEQWTDSLHSSSGKRLAGARQCFLPALNLFLSDLNNSHWPWHIFLICIVQK